MQPQVGNVKRIAVIGPESSGKSMLCEALASHFQTAWIPEYARTYLTVLKRPYRIEDIVTIYKTQFEQEQKALNEANGFLFTDTEFIIAKVWCEHVSGNCPVYINDMIQSHPYDFYLLTSPDLPWEYDPLRENPGKGEFFFGWYKSILDNFKLSYGIVKGKGDSRLQSALDLLQSHFKIK